MAHFVVTEAIDAPVERIWELLIDPSRFTEWQVGTVAVREADQRLDRVGASFITVSGLTRRSYAPQPDAPSSAFARRTAPEAARTRGFLEARWTIFRATPPVELAMEGETPAGGKGTIVQTLDSRAASTIYGVEFDFTFPAGFIGAVADRLFVSRMLHRNFVATALRLKVLAEAA